MATPWQLRGNSVLPRWYSKCSVTSFFDFFAFFDISEIPFHVVVVVIAIGDCNWYGTVDSYSYKWYKHLLLIALLIALLIPLLK